MNDTIFALEKREKQILGFIESKRESIEKNPNSFFDKLELQSLESHYSDVYQQLTIARAEAQKELIEMRLFGSRVERGSIPLSLLAKIAEPLQKSISHAVFNIVGGNRDIQVHKKKHVVSETLKSISRDLDLRLVGVGTGSTRLFITGNSTPDLADTSFLPIAVESIIGLLNATEDTFYDFAHHIGSKSSFQIKELIEELEKESASVDLTWYSESGEAKVWHGKRHEIRKVSALLSKLGEPETRERQIRGEVVLLAKTGRMEVLADNIKFKIKYPARLFSDVSEKMRIGQLANLKISEKSYFDEVRQQDIKQYDLLEVL